MLLACVTWLLSFCRLFEKQKKVNRVHNTVGGFRVLEKSFAIFNHLVFLLYFVLRFVLWCMVDCVFRM